MIVKNEERNIEKALGWAKSIIYEQIVVDTGSTDRTVELAKQMGAKVYHFEWIDDFAAARNYAMEQATGDWILVIDTDEYFSTEDAEKLIAHVARVDTDSGLQDSCLALGCPAINIDDDGNPISKSNNIRIVRNLPSIRFNGRIHEHLDMIGDKIIWMNDICLIHTGYSKSELEGKNKIRRNIDLLRIELKNDPDNMSLKAYLADSLKLSDEEADIIEAEMLLWEVIESDAVIIRKLKIKTYMNLLNRYIDKKDEITRCEDLCKKALDEFPGNIDFDFFAASVLNIKKEYTAAWDILKNAEEKLIAGADTGAASYVPADHNLLYGQLLLAAQGLGDTDNILKYAKILLASNKTGYLLRPYISTLLAQDISADEVLGILGEIYDITDPGDLMLIARAAKDCGAVEFARMIMIITGELMK